MVSLASERERVEGVVCGIACPANGRRELGKEEEGERRKNNNNNNNNNNTPVKEEEDM